MKNRGTQTVMNTQVNLEEFEGMENLDSAGISSTGIYVDLNSHIDNEESHDEVELANEMFTDVDLYCFFS